MVAPALAKTVFILGKVPFAFGVFVRCAGVERKRKLGIECVE